jgi:membrane-bound inhibitor of C-type lysozyme
MRHRIFTILLCWLALSCAGGCHTAKGNLPRVEGGKPVNYLCANGERIVARYFSLSDHSLDFVKVRFPDGKEYTLPQVVSASGVRYSNDREVVWWTKGDSAFVQMRDRKGKWQIAYDKCRENPPLRP